MAKDVKIGVIGGSGFYEFLKPARRSPTCPPKPRQGQRREGEGGGREVSVKTPYGSPSDKILLAEYAGRKIAFLPRHGKKHQYPPHKINYRANLFALKKLGVEWIVAPCAVGSLKAKIKPGNFVICDQFIDRTRQRSDTFFDGPKVVHISLDRPYCAQLRKIAVKSCRKLKIPFHQKGTAVIIEGPRFSTKAESACYARIGDIINMTQYPEAALARELEMCYLNISLVTDYDTGLKGNKKVKPVTAKEVLETFKQNTEKLKSLILEIIKNLPAKRDCLCSQALKYAVIRKEKYKRK